MTGGTTEHGGSTGERSGARGSSGANRLGGARGPGGPHGGSSGVRGSPGVHGARGSPLVNGSGGTPARIQSPGGLSGTHGTAQGERERPTMAWRGRRGRSLFLCGSGALPPRGSGREPFDLRDHAERQSLSHMRFARVPFPGRQKQPTNGRKPAAERGCWWSARLWWLRKDAGSVRGSCWVRSSQPQPEGRRASTPASRSTAPTGRRAARSSHTSGRSGLDDSPTGLDAGEEPAAPSRPHGVRVVSARMRTTGPTSA